MTKCYIYVVTKRRLTGFFSAELRPAKFFRLYSGREIFGYFSTDFGWTCGRCYAVLFIMRPVTSV